MGNGKGRGLSVLAAEGLVTRYTYRCSFPSPQVSFGQDLGGMLTGMAHNAAVARKNKPSALKHFSMRGTDRHLMISQCRNASIIVLALPRHKS